MQEKGVISASRVDEIERDSIVVIRAHGVTPKVYEDLNNNGIEIIDATCPYVKKIHRLVAEMYKRRESDYNCGDKKHPEVIGINGWCDNRQ